MSLADNGYDDWWRDHAKDEFLRMSCPDVSEPPVIVKRKTEQCLQCGWAGIPPRTQNSGGATNYKCCPRCRYSWFKEID